MPYIDSKIRPQLDTMMDPIIDYLRSLKPEDQDAQLDYFFTRILASIYEPPFFNYSRALGVLSGTTLEFYRAIVAPYEEEKIKENGTVKPKPKPGKKKAA